MADFKLPDFKLRRARDSDGPELIELIERVWDEYPGCVMDVDGEVPELRRIASAHAEWGGDFRVAEHFRGAGRQGSCRDVPTCAPLVLARVAGHPRRARERLRHRSNRR